MRDKQAPVWNSFGGLGPDLDNPISQMKRVSRLRVTDFSNQLREINKHVCKPRSLTVKTEQAQESARKTAIEYSRSIPKPISRASTQRLQPKPFQSAPDPVDVLNRLLVEHGKLDRQITEIRSRYEITGACV